MSNDLLPNLRKKKLFVNLLFVPNRGFVMLIFDKNKCAQTFLVYTNLFITHCDQVQNTAELCSLLQTIICP